MRSFRPPPKRLRGFGAKRMPQTGWPTETICLALEPLHRVWHERHDTKDPRQEVIRRSSDSVLAVATVEAADGPEPDFTPIVARHPVGQAWGERPGRPRHPADQRQRPEPARTGPARPSRCPSPLLASTPAISWWLRGPERSRPILCCRLSAVRSLPRGAQPPAAPETFGRPAHFHPG